MINATTVDPAVLSSVLRRHGARLARFLPRARRGDVRGVHQARVASRRLREALPVAAVIAPEEARALRRDVRRLTAALGGVREMDVTTAAFDAAADALQKPGAAVSRVREHLLAERARRARRLRGKIGRVVAARIAARVEAVADAVDASAAHSRLDELLALRLRARARRLAAALRGAGMLYVPASLHGARIAGKKLRYSLELARDVSSLPLGRDISALRALQGTLGRLHDLQILQEHLQTVAADAAPDRAVTHAVEKMAAALEAECRELQAAFLRSVGRLSKLTARIAEIQSGHVSEPRRTPMARIRATGAATAARRVRSA